MPKNTAKRIMRLLALLALAALLCVVLGAAVLEAHHCADEHCVVCAVIHALHRVFGRLLPLAATALAALALLICVRLPGGCGARPAATGTPVRLRVRLDD